MKYVVRKSIVYVVGRIWMPNTPVCSMHYTLKPSEVEALRDEAGKVTREAVEAYLSTHTGDFSSVIDWSASLEVGDETVEFQFASAEGEDAYYETLRTVEP